MKTLQSTIGEGCMPIVLHYYYDNVHGFWTLDKVVTDNDTMFDLSPYLTHQQWLEIEMECIHNELENQE